MQPFNQGGQHKVVVGAFDGMIGLLAHSSGHGGGYTVVVGVGNCFRSWWEVEGHLAHLFSQGRGCEVAVGEVLAQIGHGGGREQGSWTMGLRLWWPWGSFGQSGRCVMVACGGGEMVGPLGCLSDHGGGYEMVGCLARSFSWGGGCKLVTGVSGEGMGVGDCGDWGCRMVINGGVVDGVVVDGASLSLSAGEGSSCAVEGGGGRW